MLNDRNHVNTLIDEMFASVLEISPPCDDEEEINQDRTIICTDDAEHCPSTTEPQGTTQIIVRSGSKDIVEYLSHDSLAGITPQDNKVVISNNLEDDSSSIAPTEMLPKTVIVIKNGDNIANENVTFSNANRDGSGDGSNYNSAERSKQVIFFVFYF